MSEPSLQVEIEWGPLWRFNRVLNTFDDPDEDFGIYQILGPHVLYGERALLYLGKTFDNFSTRLKRHLGNEAIGRYIRDYGDNWGDFRLRLGRLQVLAGQRHVTPFLLESVEAAMIRYFQPALNTRNLRSYSGRRLLIVNIGKRGPLRREIVVEPDRRRY